LEEEDAWELEEARVPEVAREAHGYYWLPPSSEAEGALEARGAEVGRQATKAAEKKLEVLRTSMKARLAAWPAEAALVDGNAHSASEGERVCDKRDPRGHRIVKGQGLAVAHVFDEFKDMRLGGHALPVADARKRLLRPEYHARHARTAWACGQHPATFRVGDRVVGQVVDATTWSTSGMGRLRSLLADRRRIAEMSDMVLRARRKGEIVAMLRKNRYPWAIRGHREDPVDAMIKIPANACHFNFESDLRGRGHVSEGTYPTTNSLDAIAVFEEKVLPWAEAIAEAIASAFPDAWARMNARPTHRKQYGLPFTKFVIGRNNQTTLHKDDKDLGEAALLIVHDVEDGDEPPVGGELWWCGLPLALGHGSLFVFDASEAHANTSINTVREGSTTARLAFNLSMSKACQK